MPPSSAAAAYSNLTPNTPYNLVDTAVNYCQVSTPLQYITCLAGRSGNTTAEFFTFTNSADEANPSDLVPGTDSVFLKSTATGMYCRVTTMTTTRNGILCDAATANTATAFTYSANGLLSGLGAIMSDGANWQLYHGVTSTASNVDILPPPPGTFALPPSPPGVSPSPPPPMPPAGAGTPLTPGAPYVWQDNADPAQYCRSDNGTQYVYCSTMGVGKTGNEQWQIYYQPNPLSTAPILDGQAVIMKNMGTGLWCRRVLMSLTREGFLCDANNVAWATPMVYKNGGIMEGTDYLLTDGAPFIMYFGPGPVNNKLSPAPTQFPSPLPPPPAAPPFPPMGPDLQPISMQYTMCDLSSGSPAFCQVAHNVTYIACISGTTGTSGPEKFVFFNPTNLASTALIKQFEQVIMQSTATNMYCR